jgi:hypothetical protein
MKIVWVNFISFNYFKFCSKFQKYKKFLKWEIEKLGSKPKIDEFVDNTNFGPYFFEKKP